MNVRPVFDQLLAWSLKILFVAVFVVPILYWALYLNDLPTGSGRVGFLLPAIVLADALHRQALLTALAGSFSAALAACLIGTVLGLVAAQSSKRAFRAVRCLALLPGRMPAWVIPACIAIGQYGLGMRAIPDSIKIYVWIAWVGWWGATRIGDILAIAVRSVSRSEWDAARTLAGGSIPALKVALVPRVAADYRKEAKRVAGVCLFDPTPVFFLGLENWPIAYVSRRLAASDLRNAVDASAWLVWLILIWIVVAFAFRLACGNHGRQHLVIPDGERMSELRVLPPARSRAWLLPATWPVLAASVLMVSSCVRMMPKASGLRLDAIFEWDWAWGSSMAFGSVVALTAAVILSILARFADVGRAVQFLDSLTSFWPLEAAICSAGILTIAADRFLAGQGSNIPGRLVGEIWSLVFFFFVVAGIGSISIRQAHRNRGRTPSADLIAQAASDSARILGIPKRHSAKLAIRTWRKNQTKISAASMLLSAWWLWNSPSWALVPNWSVSSIPTGGQMLVSRFTADNGQETGLAGILLVLCVAMMLMIFEWAGDSKIRRMGSGS